MGRRFVVVLTVVVLISAVAAGRGTDAGPSRDGGPTARSVYSELRIITRPGANEYHGSLFLANRTNALGFINPQTAVVGTAGGLVRTTNGGKDWKAVLLEGQRPSIGAIGIDLANRRHLVVGTGDPSIACGARPNTGAFESTNGGASFRRLGGPVVLPGRAFSSVLVRGHSIFAGIVDASESGGPCYTRAESGDAGLFKWGPGTKKWNRVKGLPEGQVTQIDADPARPRRFVTSVFAKGLYESENAGRTWNIVSNLPFSSVGRFAFSFVPRPGEESLLAVAVENLNTHGLFSLANQREDGAFDFWPSPPLPEGLSRHCVCRSGMFFGRLGQHHYFAGTDIWRTGDAGTNWTNLSRGPGDRVGKLPITWNGMLKAGARYVAWGERGSFFATNPTGKWRPFDTSYIGTITRSVAPDPVRRVGGLWCGAQGDGVRFAGNQATVVSGSCGSLEAEIREAFTAGWAAIECNRNVCERTRDGGRTWTLAESFPADAFAVPIEPEIVYNPANADNVFIAHRGVFSSLDGGDNWTFILNSSQIIDITSPDVTGLHQVSAMTITGDGSTLLAGTTEGRLVSLGTESPNATKVLGVALPDRPITGIAVHPTDAKQIYLTVSGYNADAPGRKGHVFASTNGGVTFTDITLNLGDAPVYDVLLDDERNLLVVAAEDGAYFKPDIEGNLWLRIRGMPSGQPVIDLASGARGHEVWLATHGAGTYRLNGLGP